MILHDTVELPQSVLDGTDPVTPGRKVTTAKGVTVPAELIVSGLSHARHLFPMRE